MCVEVAFNSDDDQVRIRDSKDRTGPTLAFTPGEWEAFVGGVRSGEFDLPDSREDRSHGKRARARTPTEHPASPPSATGEPVEVAYVGGQVRIRDSKSGQGQTLAFEPADWQEFVDDVRDGEFDLDDARMADRVREAFQGIAPTISAQELIERAIAEEHSHRHGD